MENGRRSQNHFCKLNLVMFGIMWDYVCVEWFSNGPFVHPPKQYMSYYGTVIDPYWHGKSEELGEEPVPLCLSQIPLYWSGCEPVSSRWLTTWATTLSKLILTYLGPLYDRCSGQYTMFVNVIYRIRTSDRDMAYTYKYFVLSSTYTRRTLKTFLKISYGRFHPLSF